MPSGTFACWSLVELGDGVVEPVHVCGAVLAVVELIDLARDVWFQGGVVVLQIRKGVLGHDTSPVRTVAGAWAGFADGATARRAVCGLDAEKPARGADEGNHGRCLPVAGVERRLGCSAEWSLPHSPYGETPGADASDGLAHPRAAPSAVR